MDKHGKADFRRSVFRGSVLAPPSGRSDKGGSLDDGSLDVCNGACGRVLGGGEDQENEEKEREEKSMTPEKREWLKSIGAAEFPEPIKYIYTFQNYNGAFNLSERYVNETPIEKLKAQYEKNKEHAEEVIKAKKSRDNFLRGAEPL